MSKLECIDGPNGCDGKIEYRMTPDRRDFKSFPRCEYHFDQRLALAERNAVYNSPLPPDDFDPWYAGEEW